MAVQPSEHQDCSTPLVKLTTHGCCLSFHPVHTSSVLCSHPANQRQAATRPAQGHSKATSTAQNQALPCIPLAMSAGFTPFWSGHQCYLCSSRKRAYCTEKARKRNREKASTSAAMKTSSDLPQWMSFKKPPVTSVVRELRTPGITASPRAVIIEIAMRNSLISLWINQNHVIQHGIRTGLQFHIPLSCRI